MFDMSGGQKAAKQHFLDVRSMEGLGGILGTHPNSAFFEALQTWSVRTPCCSLDAPPRQSGPGVLARRPRQPFDEVVRDRLARREGNAGLGRL